MISCLILMKTKKKRLMSALTISLVLITNLILYLCQCFNNKTISFFLCHSDFKEKGEIL